MTNERFIVGVLETGRPPENLAKTFPDYPAMVADWLSPVDTVFRSHAILDGRFPTAPEDCDLWVVTGSRYGAYEDHDWIAPLEAFIRACRAAGRPMVGICFGHQIIAQALGGTVRKSDRGWGLGVTSYPVSDWPEALGGAPDRFDMQAFHQDQVESPPEGAQVIAATAFCPNAALWYPGFALTVQGHPEFSSAYVSALLRERRGSLLRTEEADRALASQSAQTNADMLGRIVRNTFLNPDSLKDSPKDSPKEDAT